MSGSSREYHGSWRGQRNGDRRSDNPDTGREPKNWSSHRNDRSRNNQERGAEGVDKFDTGKRKGYQEARKQDQDRRDRRNERLGRSAEDYSEKSKVEETMKKPLAKEKDLNLVHSNKDLDTGKKINSSEKRCDKPDKRHDTKYSHRDKYDQSTPFKSKNEIPKPVLKDTEFKYTNKESGDAQPVKHVKYNKESIANATKESATKTKNDSEEKEAAKHCRASDLMNILQKNTSSKKSNQQEKEPKVKNVKTKGMTASDLEKKWQKEEEERIKEEAEDTKREEEIEKKRQEEERKIKEEEEKKIREKEECERITKEEIKSVEDFIKLTQESIDHKLILREQNLHAAENYPDDAFFSRLDSSLKKNTTFVKKVKNITENQKESLTKDFSALNLTKYIGELANGITEAKLKMSDIGCALHLSSLAHCRYAEFSAAFLESWQKVLLSKKDEKVPNPSKLRVDLRFFADLVMCGVFTEKDGLPILANQLTLLTTNDKEEHNNLSIIISFCKHCGDDYAGLVPQKYSMLAEKYNLTIPRSCILPEERKKGCRKLLKEYYTSLCTHLLNEHKELKSIERHNRKILQTKGELSQDRKDKHEEALQTFQKLMQNTNTFADLLVEEIPPLPVERIETEDEIIGIDIYSPENEYVYDGENTLFEDEDTRQFYENLPDLKSIVPQILYKDSEQALKSDKNSEEQETVTDEELNVEDLEKEMEKGQKETDISMEEEPPPVEMDDDEFDIAASMRQILDAFLNSLPTCINRDLIDKAAIDFCMNMNTKANRKKLVKTLFTVQRTRYDLLPFYARLIATLHPCMPEVASDLVALLKGDFKWHVRKKDQINIESKLKTVRFIGELVKFEMFPKTEALHCIKMLLFDFSHHNIEMACSLLETCGRFLYRSPDSHHRTKIYLAVMMRKKAALHLDQRYCTLIENAFYYSNPPESKKTEVIQRPPMHEYIRKLLYKDLSKITTEKILRQMRKLNWDADEVAIFATQSLTAIWNVRYNVIHCCANLLAGLAAYHEKVAVSVVDGVIEDIRLGLEINHPKYNQRRVSTVKYLGELYNYRLVESSVIFKTLYLFITFGISYEEGNQSPLDPPEHLFRIRLVCVLLDTCGQYFDRGSSKKKLDCFLVYFQNYYWFKRKNAIWTDDHPFPLEMEYSYHDTLEVLRPKLVVALSYEEASKAVEELEKEFRQKLNEILPKKADDEFDTQLEDSDGILTTIRETDEIEELSQNMSQVQLIGSDVMTPQSQSQESDDGYRSTQRSGSQSQSQQREGDEDEEQTGEKDYEDEIDSHSDLDTEDDNGNDINLLTGGLKVIKCTEDDDFMTSFDKMLQDTIQNRMQESTKVPSLDIAVPMHIKSQKTKYFVPGEEDVAEEEDVESGSGSGIKFVLMTRKGNKQQFSNLSVPVSEKFAAEYKERENKEKLEKERMKRVVLNIHERQEEEDYQEMMASMTKQVVPKEPKQRQYHHPKGVPDVDLIFGSKKR